MVGILSVDDNHCCNFVCAQLHGRQGEGTVAPFNSNLKLKVKQVPVTHKQKVERGKNIKCVASDPGWFVKYLHKYV